MKSTDQKRFVLRLSFFFCIVLITMTVAVNGQVSEVSSRNNPYSPSPSRKIKTEGPPVKQPLVSAGTNDIAFVMQRSSGPVEDERRPLVDVRPTIAQATFKLAREAETNGLPPTEIYKIGIGDVLFISLNNSTQGSGYFTVRNDGTIDYPLSGDNVVVTGQTIGAVEDIIVGGITLFASPQVEVKVRQYVSHKIMVAGMVESAGEKSLQREAMPLFAIKAESQVSPKATKVTIGRGQQTKAEIYDLRDPKTDDILIFPGDKVDFSGDGGAINAGGSFFIGGEVVNGGQKDLSSNLTLYQAVVISGGTKGDPKKAIIRRKNEKGMFTVLEHNLRSIKAGKAMDPFLAEGDVIEIKN